MELIFQEADVLVAFIDPVVIVVDGDRLPRFLRELTLLGTAYCHQFKYRGEVFHVFDDLPGLFIDI